MDYGEFHLIDKIPNLDIPTYLLFSALITSINENYNQRFEICLTSDNGFYIYIPAQRFLNISYKNYELVDNFLYEFDNEQEHIAFLRKQKINSL